MCPQLKDCFDNALTFIQKSIQVYLAEGLFQDAQALRKIMGDTAFFAKLSESGNTDSGWGELANSWDADRFETEINAGPGDEERSQLTSALVKQFFGSYDIQAGSQEEAS